MAKFTEDLFQKGINFFINQANKEIIGQDFFNLFEEEEKEEDEILSNTPTYERKYKSFIKGLEQLSRTVSNDAAVNILLKCSSGALKHLEYFNNKLISEYFKKEIEIKKLQHTNELLKRKIEQLRFCNKCSKENSNILLLPCRHHSMCRECATQHGQCTTCFKEIKAIQKIY